MRLWMRQPPSSEQFALRRLPDWCKRTSMERRRTQPFEDREMFPRAIAFMPGKAIVRKLSIVLDHHPVTGDLGNDRSGGNAETLAIAADDARLRQFQVRD